jgi:hypothetical protein
VETEVIMKNWDEYEALVRAGDYDIVRRGLVMQTSDELTNIRMMFRTNDGNSATGSEPLAGETADEPIETEDQALRELKAVPIYFASSYSLVKPYVSGFHTNVLDSPSLKTIRIDTTWSPPEGNQ